MNEQGSMVTTQEEPDHGMGRNGLSARRVHPLSGILETLIPPEVAKDKQATAKWIWRVISDPDRACDSASVDRRLTLIGHLEDIMRTGFSNTADLRQHLDRFLNGHDGRRLPVGKAIKRARKKAGLSQMGLADLLGLRDHTLISKYESGKRVPPLKVMEWLKGAEGVTRRRSVKGKSRTPSDHVISSRGNEGAFSSNFPESSTSPKQQECSSAVATPAEPIAQSNLFLPADPDGLPLPTDEDSNV